MTLRLYIIFTNFIEIKESTKIKLNQRLVNLMLINQIISNLAANYINDLIQDPNSTKQLIQTVLNYLENSAIDLLNLLLIRFSFINKSLNHVHH